MLFKLLPILAVAALVHGRSANSDDKDVDTLIREIFGDETTKSSVANPTKISVANPTESSVGIPTKKPGEEDTCKLKSGEQGVCVPYYLCGDLQETEPAGVIDLRIDEERVCSTYFEVCCDDSKMRSILDYLRMRENSMTIESGLPARAAFNCYVGFSLL